MFEYNGALTDTVFDYCRERLAMTPVPLDYGSLTEVPLHDLAGLIRPQGHDPEEIIAFFKNELAHAVVSIDAPNFLAFIPNAPTKNSLLFDMVVACSGLNGTSWLESAGVVVAENQALAFLADLAGMPFGSGGAFVSGGSMGNLSGLTVGRDVGRSTPRSPPTTYASPSPPTRIRASAKRSTCWALKRCSCNPTITDSLAGTLKRPSPPIPTPRR